MHCIIQLSFAAKAPYTAKVYGAFCYFKGRFHTMMDMITQINSTLNGIVWGWPALILLAFVGVLTTCITKFFQVTHFGHWMKNTIGAIFKDSSVTSHTADRSISQFQSLCTALAATVGTGNIVGVAGAILVGGPGAVFWMWLIAFFGMMTNYSENVLGIYYRRKNEQGVWCGGAMYYLHDGLCGKKGCKWIGKILAVAFSVFCFLASFGIGNMTQVNSISGNMNAVCGGPAWGTGLVILVMSALVIVGGLKRIATVTEKIVPFMVLIYMVGSIAILVMNIRMVPAVFAAIFKGAFAVKAAGGGIVGYGMKLAIEQGMKRGVFSNEAGLGSAPIAAAAAKTDHASRQGYVNMTGTFFDTMIICVLPGLVIASSGMLGTIDPETGKAVSGAQMTILAFSSVFGEHARVIVSTSLALFAFSTILGWEYYGEKALEYLVSNHDILVAYRVIFSFITYVGATQTLDLVWDFSDTANGLMAIPNLICLLWLSKDIVKECFDYEDRVVVREKQGEKVDLSVEG